VAEGAVTEVDAGDHVTARAVAVGATRAEESSARLYLGILCEDG
jgi:hypothetical protein